MKFNLKKPCAKCPFRSDVPGYLTSARAREIANYMLTDNVTFSCHKHIKGSSDEDQHSPYHPGLKDQHCAGAILFLEGQNGHNQMIQVAQRLGLYDPTTIERPQPIFSSIEDMAQHHKSRTIPKEWRPKPQDEL